MAYDLKERFSPPPTAYQLLEPGAYQSTDNRRMIFDNKVPFLARTPRITRPGAKLWTHAIYDADLPPKIPNITSMTSKRPRFPYEALSKEDLEALLCRCGIQSPCECPTEDAEEKLEVTCQGKVRRRLFKGLPSKSITGGLSANTKRDHGFEVFADGSQKRFLEHLNDESPPFYDTTIHESTEFYHGCKWSHWTSKRSSKSLEVRPGPADYNFEKQSTDFEICAENFRFFRRQTSKQLRFIEMVQQRNIIEGGPGPASYSPLLPQGYDNGQCLGPKAKRFMLSRKEIRPGPADHFVKRAFDLPESPEKPCHAKLPEPSFFGIKAQRFKSRREEGASPASYSPNYNRCHLMHCSSAPFGSSTARFKEVPIDEDNKEVEVIAEDEPQKKCEEGMIKETCPSPSWEFKSKTIRMKPLEKKNNEASPADFPQPRTKVHRLRQLQHVAPFFTSEGRFEPWNDWMSVFGREKTPGPCYYCQEKPECYPAVKCGPLYRVPRFSRNTNDNPPPNRYQRGGGIETILATHNQRLKENIDNQHKFVWVQPIEPKRLSYEEQEAMLLSKSIALLETDMFDEKTTNCKTSSSDNKTSSPDSSPRNVMPQSKKLRCHVYGSQMPHCV